MVDVLAGTVVFANTLTNTGTVQADGGNITVSAAETDGGNARIFAGSQLEYAAQSNEMITFVGTGGTLKLDTSVGSATTHVQIAGQLFSGNQIDLADITAGANATIGYTGTNSPGTLTVSDGVRTASLGLLGIYSVSEFVASSDGHGGTTITVSSPGQVLSGAIAAGSINFTSTPAPTYVLEGATITGSNNLTNQTGINVQTTDANTADELIVQMDQASSISLTNDNSNNNNVGLNLTTQGANIFVETAGPISAPGAAAGSYGINAQVVAGNGSVSIDALSNITGGFRGINASAAGSGAVNVNVERSVSVAGVAGAGIFALSTGTGAVAVSTAAGDIINSGSSGIVTQNQGSAVPAQTTVKVTANGTINSGVTPTGTGNLPAGIQAGFNGGTGSQINTPNPNVLGNVTVDDFANISAAAGDGIRAFNFGSGNVTVLEEANTTISAGSRYEISASNYAGGSISVSTSPGDIINSTSGGAGISLNNFSTTAGAGSTVSVKAYGTINSGTVNNSNGSPAAGILAGYNSNDAAEPNVAGSVIVDNFASITAPAGTYGIEAYNFGTGSVTVTEESTATITAGSAGIFAYNASTTAGASSKVSVTAYGTINSGSSNVFGGSPAAGILAGYNSNSAAEPNVAGSVIVDDFAAITAAANTDGIRAFNYGTGNITVTAEPSASITGGRYGIGAFGNNGGNVSVFENGTVSGGTYGIDAAAILSGNVNVALGVNATVTSTASYGIFANTSGTGNVSVSTSSGDVINSGSDGILALNSSTVVPSTSTITVKASGNINSGSALTGGGFTPSGIDAGYNSNNLAEPNVAGAVIVDDFASIVAPAGANEINAFNYGTGNITVTAESGASITAGNYGIGAFGHNGGTVGLTLNAGSIVSGTSQGIAISTGTGAANITNNGQVSGPSAAGLAVSETGGSITIDNFNEIIGDVSLANTTFNNHSGAVWTISGSNVFGAGADAINNAGTIDVIGNSNFTATGTLTINNTGIVDIKSGALVIAGSLTGTGSIIIENGASLEISGSVAANEILTFAGTTGTVKFELATKQCHNFWNGG